MIIDVIFGAFGLLVIVSIALGSSALDFLWIPGLVSLIAFLAVLFSPLGIFYWRLLHPSQSLPRQEEDYMLENETDENATTTDAT